MTLVATVLLMLVAAWPAGAQQRSRTLFDTRVSFWSNLHHFAYAHARARLSMDLDRTAIIAAIGDTAALQRATRDERSRWESLVVWYRDSLAKRDLIGDSALNRLTRTLASLKDSAARPVGVPVELRRRLERAAPMYRRLWWRSHRDEALGWIADAQPLLQSYGPSIASSVARAFGIAWPDSAIPVQVGAFAGWPGAYAVDDPAQLWVSSRSPDLRGSLGVEMLFHEALHTLEDSIQVRRSVLRRAGTPLPYEGVHAMIFHTAGELTRLVIPGHRPYQEATGMLERSGFVLRYHETLRAHWQPWLSGHGSLDSALYAIAQCVRQELRRGC